MKAQRRKESGEEEEQGPSAQLVWLQQMEKSADDAPPSPEVSKRAKTGGGGRGGAASSSSSGAVVAASGGSPAGSSAWASEKLDELQRLIGGNGDEALRLFKLKAKRSKRLLISWQPRLMWVDVQAVSLMLCASVPEDEAAEGGGDDLIQAGQQQLRQAVPAGGGQGQ